MSEADYTRAYSSVKAPSIIYLPNQVQAETVRPFLSVPLAVIAAVCSFELSLVTLRMVQRSIHNQKDY